MVGFHTSETRAKMSAARKAYWERNPERRKEQAEMRARQNQEQNARGWSPAMRAKMEARYARERLARPSVSLKICKKMGRPLGSKNKPTFRKVLRMMLLLFQFKLGLQR